jgi:hypothetical protein
MLLTGSRKCFLYLSDFVFHIIQIWTFDYSSSTSKTVNNECSSKCILLDARCEEQKNILKNLFSEITGFKKKFKYTGNPRYILFYGSKNLNFSLEMYHNFLFSVSCTKTVIVSFCHFLLFFACVQSYNRRTGVNFTNILKAAFAPIFLRQKSVNLLSVSTKMPLEKLSYKKSHK